jgi:RNA polymerase sigma-70 factor, ECF subfamily
MTTSSIPTELIQRAQSSDPQALSAIYERYSSGIYRYIYYRVGDVEQARDLHADVFLRMCESIGRYEDRGWSIAAWLYRIAHDRTIDTLRRRERHTPQPLEEWSELVDGPEDGAELSGERAALRRAMDQLCEPQRRVLLLRFTYDLSLQETARQMGRSLGSVKALQHRALQALGRLVRAELGEE